MQTINVQVFNKTINLNIHIDARCCRYNEMICPVH